MIVFAIYSNDFIVYEMSDEEEVEYISNRFRKHFNNPKIEVVYTLNNSQRYESGIFRSMEDFENFKDELLAPITESEMSELPPMPKWAERAKRRG